MKFTPTELKDVVLVDPVVNKDERGFFLESYHRLKYGEGGVDAVFVQDNHSRSVKGTLRGLHFQVKHPQGKLIRVTKGEIFDVAVDIRVGSPQFKKWVGVSLSESNFRLLYVPPGFAHGFVVLSNTAEVEYKCTDFYHEPDEAGIIWNDSDIGIKWPITSPLLSARDKNAPRLKDIVQLLPSFAASPR